MGSSSNLTKRSKRLCTANCALRSWSMPGIPQTYDSISKTPIEHSFKLYSKRRRMMCEGKLFRLDKLFSNPLPASRPVLHWVRRDQCDFERLQTWQDTDLYIHRASQIVATILLKDITDNYIVINTRSDFSSIPDYSVLNFIKRPKI